MASSSATGAPASGHHGGEDGAGHLEHRVDVAVHEGLALVGAVLHLKEVFGVVVAHPNIVHKQADVEALIKKLTR